MSEDAGSTCSWVTGKPQYGFLPHKGVLSPAEKTLHISFPTEAIALDKSNNTAIYGGSAGSFYVSTNSATSFTKTTALGSSTAVNAIRAYPSIAGDIWATTDTGLWHSSDYGKTFTKIGGGCPTGWSFGLGRPSPTGSYAVIYGFFTVDGTTALFETEEMGTNWQMISDSSHGFGAASANAVNGDMANYGRVFVGTNGRGIFYGQPSGSVPSPTATGTTTKTTSMSTKTSGRTSSTTLTKTSTSTSKTTTSLTSTGTSTPYGECGGTGYTGPTVCPSGWKCTYQNAYYSQCLQ